MTTPTNTEIFNAIAAVLDCRSHRRGRKSPLCITILTTEQGITVVTDHNTGCEQTIGKRKYTKRAPIKTNRKYTKRAKSVAIPIATTANVEVEPSQADLLRDAINVYKQLKAAIPANPKFAALFTKRLESAAMQIRSLGGVVPE